MLTSVPLDHSSGSVEIHPGMDCYEVVEDLPLTGKFRMVAAFHDVEDGTGIVLTAPGGLRIDSWTRVVKLKGRGREGWELEEQVRREGNRLLLPFVEGNVIRARKAVHEGLIEQIEKERDHIQSMSE